MGRTLCQNFQYPIKTHLRACIMSPLGAPRRRFKDQLEKHLALDRNRSNQLGNGSYRKKQLEKSSPRKEKFFENSRRKIEERKRDQSNRSTLAFGGYKRLFICNIVLTSHRRKCRCAPQYSATKPI